MDTDSGYSSDWRNNGTHTETEVHDYFFSDDDGSSTEKTGTDMEEESSNNTCKEEEKRAVASILNEIDVSQYLDEISNTPVQSQSSNSNSSNRYNEEQVRTERTERMCKQEEFFPHENVPMELRWDELEECIQEWADPNLADRMRRLRMCTKEETEDSEILIVNYEIRLNKMKQEKELQKEEMTAEIVRLENRERQNIEALNKANYEKERAESKCVQVTAEKEIREQELKFEITLRKHKENVTKIWKNLCKEKEIELKRRGVRNEELTKKVGELRMQMEEWKREAIKNKNK